MKNKINTIVQAIENKRTRLKEKTEMYFKAISIPAGSVNHKENVKKATPPISYLLYGGAAVLGAFAVNADSMITKTFLGGLTIASGYGGYKLSSGHKPANTTIDNNTRIQDVKNDVTSKVIDNVKRITSDWDEFMELKQKDLQQSILLSAYTNEEKDSMISKIFIYETIDISLLEINNIIKSASDFDSIKKDVETCKAEVLKAIDTAVDKQIVKYNSICS